MRAKRSIESGQMEREYNALERDPRDAAAFSPPGGMEVRSGSAQLQIGESIASHAEPRHDLVIIKASFEIDAPGYVVTFEWGAT